MTVNERIAHMARQSAGLTAAFVWKWGKEHGWKPRKGETPDGRNEKTGRHLPWCAMAASYRVWIATRGEVVLCRGYRHGRRGVFEKGTDSVPVILDWAKDFGLFVSTPTPGCIALIEARGRNDDGTLKDWTGRPNHVGTVETVGNGFAKVREGNYAKRDALVTRYFEVGADAKEMVVAWVNVSKMATSSAFAVIEMDAPDGDDTTADGIVEVGDDDVCVATFIHETALRRARVTRATDEGVFVQVIRDDGQVDMTEPELAPVEYVMFGRWEVP